MAANAGRGITAPPSRNFTVACTRLALWLLDSKQDIGMLSMKMLDGRAKNKIVALTKRKATGKTGVEMSGIHAL